MEFGWPGYRILLGKIGQLGKLGELDPIKNISLNYAKKGHFHDKNEQFRIKIIVLAMLILLSDKNLLFPFFSKY